MFGVSRDKIVSNGREIILVQGERCVVAQETVERRIATVIRVGIDTAARGQERQTENIGFLGWLSGAGYTLVEQKAGKLARGSWRASASLKHVQPYCGFTCCQLVIRSTMSGGGSIFQNCTFAAASNFLSSSKGGPSREFVRSAAAASWVAA